MKKWIKIETEMPEVQERIELAYVPQGAGGTRWGWQTTGWLTKGLNWSLKKPYKGFHGVDKPTHWRKLQEK